MDKNEVRFQCSDCGADLPAGAASCPNCGAKLVRDKEESQERTECKCPGCGATVSPRQSVCGVCGAPLHDTPAFSLSPMSLGDIFSRTVQLIGKAFFRYLLIALIIFIPATVLFTVALDGFYSTAGSAVRGNDLAGFSESGVLLFLAFVLVFCAYLAVSVGVVAIVRGELHGGYLPWQKSLRSATSVYFWRAVGQIMIVVIALAGIFIALTIFISLASVYTGGVLLAIPVFLATFAGIAYLFVRWSLALPAIVCEDAGVLKALSRSWKLVGGSWWRVFGIMLLMGLLTGFAVTIISAPVTFVVFWDFYRDYFKMLRASGGVPDTQMVSKMFDSMGVGMGVSTGINLMFSGLVAPIYTALLYYDLRARKGEFQISRTPEQTGTSSVQQPEPREGAEQL